MLFLFQEITAKLPLLSAQDLYDERRVPHSSPLELVLNVK
jgi:hypothetical protein